MVDLPEFLRPNAQAMIAAQGSNYSADPAALPYTWAANERKRAAMGEYTRLMQQQNAMTAALTQRALETERQKAAATLYGTVAPYNADAGSGLSQVMAQMGMPIEQTRQGAGNVAMMDKGRALEKLFGATKIAAETGSELAKQGHVSEGPINLPRLGSGDTTGYGFAPELLDHKDLASQLQIEALKGKNQIAAAAAGNSGGGGGAGQVKIASPAYPGALPTFEMTKVPTNQAEAAAQHLISLTEKLRSAGGPASGDKGKKLTEQQKAVINHLAQKEQGRVREVGVRPDGVYEAEVTRNGRPVRIEIAPDGNSSVRQVTR